MNHIKEFLLDGLYGLKKMFIAIGVLLLACSIVWGIISGLMTIFGTIEYTWWNIPFWVLDVFMLAECFGQDRR